MKTISQTLNSLQAKCALIPFITAGDPHLSVTEQAVKILDSEGADVIEIGLPYSDPLADGPIIQEASKKALAGGVTVDQVFDLLSRVHNSIDAPIVLFTYYNPILARGINTFLEDLSLSGAKGLIVPDLPLEEADYVITVCRKYNLELILLITPVTSSQRIDKILSKAQGIIYIVSSTGVTGLRQEIKQEMKSFIQCVKEKSDQKLIIGFGISSQDHVQKVSQWNIDGIVMGSAFVKCLSDENPKEGLVRLKTFCSQIKASFL